ncbi:DUF1850 domain-containing protein [Bacillus changyiensis]|uniref:DUF1850 domain-containing protein n=1 Tax=Bacillus changyiensis TaxID=3004103 RepID=UPI0022E29913|nr:DUF1850 domain-containing protein [Bacillus changyiensis]MDA1474943.1 DUF1850 domain-containing protein [Bacillus changyiensis]
MKKYRLIIMVCFLVAILTLLFLCLIPSQKSVVFTKEDSGEIVAYLPLQEEQSFEIIYTHSIHKTKVIETYVCKQQKLKQIALTYHDPAVGMPANAEPGEKLVIKDGIYTISNMKRTFPFIDMRIGRVRANHRIGYVGKVYQLKRFIRPGSWVRMSVQHLNKVQQLKGVKING